MAKLKVGVLISGRGSNLQALIDAASADDYPAEIVTVISNVPGAVGLERAAKAGIPTNVVDHRDFQNRETFEDALNDVLSAAAVELLCLAGFMRLVTDGFAGRWRDRLVNVHPSLLPAFKGLDTHKRALQAGVRIAGCTVHFVRAEVDVGPIIAQAAVAVLPGDDEESLGRRVLEQEHRLYPLAVELIARGQVRIEGGRAHVLGAWSDDNTALINPLLVTEK